MSTLYYTEEQNPHLAQLRILSSLLNNRLSTSKIASRFAPIIYHEGSLVLNEPNAIALHLAHNSKLAGPTFDEQVQVYSWLEYFNNELLPLVAQIYGQADLKIPLSQPKFAYALEELKKVLKVLDDRLKMRTFLVGDSLTLADISLCCSLERAFVLVIAPELRKKHTSLTRWFNYVRNVPAFVDHLGEVKLCEQAYEPDYTMNALKQQKTPQNEAVKVQTAGSEEIPKKQETGVLNFLVEFKKSFQKAEDKAKVLDDLLSHFPAEFSLWRVYYSKDVVEGKDENATVQKAKEMVDSLQTVNSQTFGTLGVYLAEETKQYEIRGVMMWRGAEVSQAWKEHKDHQYYIFHKLEAAPDAEVVRQYWLDQPKAEGLSLRKSFQLA